MLSLRAKLVLKVIKNYLNINPFECKDPVSRLKKLEDRKTKFDVPKGFTHEVIDLKESKIEIIKPAVDKSKNLVYILHGGAYIVKLTNLYRASAKAYSDASFGGDVALIDYRVSPEHKFPSALDDALEGWEYLLSQGYTPEKTVFVGDSAGGNLVLSLLLKMRDMGYKMPKSAVCMSPWTDMTLSGSSYIDNFKNDVMFGGKNEVSKEMVDDMLKYEIFSFVGDADRKNPYVSPLYGDFRNFPKTFFLVGSDEILLSDTLNIKAKMDEAGIETKLIIGEKMFHVWPLFGKLFPEAKKDMSEILKYISDSLR